MYCAKYAVIGSAVEVASPAEVVVPKAAASCEGGQLWKSPLSKGTAVS